MKFTRKIKIAFVHDDFIQFGGAEKLILEIVREFQNDNEFEVTVFASIISKKWQSILNENKINFKESFLSSLPFVDKYSKFLFFTDLFYIAFSNFDFEEYDVVFSSSTRYAHFLITKPKTFHISYLNSPSRALWDEKKYFFGKKFFYFFIKNFLPEKRILDFYSQTYADLIISNSKNIAFKVKKYYLRNSIVLYPFLNYKNNQIETKKDSYFLIISRLVSWKRLDYVIEAFNLSGHKLIIVGIGPELERYAQTSNKNIEFRGYISEAEKFKLIKHAQALIFPQDEDFGITLLEALKFNCPIIYLNKGGAKEILNSKLGISFENQNIKDLEEALVKFKSFKPEIEAYVKAGSFFNKDYFSNYLKRLINQKLSKSKSLV